MALTTRRFALLFFGAAAIAACNQKHVASPDTAAAALRAADEIVFGFELKHVCKLQRNKGDVPAAGATPKDWESLESAAAREPTFQGPRQADHRGKRPRAAPHDLGRAPAQRRA